MTLGRVPTRALEFEDTFFKVIAHRQSLYQQAYRSGMQKGKRGEALASYIAEYVYDPPKVALKSADAHAKYVTLQSDLDTYGKSISRLRNVPVARYFIPFFKTPYNAFKYSLIDRGTIGIFLGEGRAAIRKARLPGASAADKAAGDMALARLALGNMTFALIAYLTATGEISGKGPENRNLRSSYRGVGWSPYSLKYGDERYGYTWADSSSEPFVHLRAASSQSFRLQVHSRSSTHASV